MRIQKVGRTTEKTTGTIISIDTDVRVGYSSGNAIFIDQIVTSRSFCKAGDSGSLVITNDSNKNPVGLLYAGTSNGTAVLNHIDDVLEALGVTICSQ